MSLLAVTHEGQQEIRQSIHQIAEDNNINSNLSNRLSRLAQRFGQFTNTQLLLIIRAWNILSGSNQLHLTRFLQEANQRQTSWMAPKIEIQLSLREKESELTVKDFGQGA